MSGFPPNGTADWVFLSHLVRRERNWLYRQRHPSHSQRITMSGLVEYRGDLLSVWGRTHAEIRCGTPHLHSFYHDLLGHDSDYITTRV